MSKVGQPERVTQNRVVKLFQELEWDYLGNWEDRENNSNIEEEKLRTFLKDRYSTSLIDKAVFEIKKAAAGTKDKLYFNNLDFYQLLRYGVKVKAAVSENKETVWVIDWQNPLNNNFAIAEEVSIKGEHTKRPDVVLYVNGIALGVIELKRSSVNVSKGIRQNLDNQAGRFIRDFFNTMQLVMAGNDTQGLRYGTIETSEKYYLKWKEESDIQNLLDRHITQVCSKERFLEIIKDFIVFDAGTKKLCRHNQYFGVKAAQKFIHHREGGIIWHTQGSGKSLSMVWLTKWVLENQSDSRVLIITDRDELDKQIEKVFKGVGEQIERSKSGADLIKKLNSNKPSLLCSLVHKFGRKETPDYDNFLEELTKSLPKDFKVKGNLFVFVDECHRTQSGKLHTAMKGIMPDALFIGFTGTPLLKADKQKSIEVFGPYIHTYKFDEAVKDKVVLDLRYEARNIDQNLTSKNKVDDWFDSKTKGLPDYAKAELKRRWGTLQKVFSSKDRLEAIVSDIMYDMVMQPRLATGQGNAILVAGSIYQACRYYDLFQQRGFHKCAIITSYEPNIAHVKGESTGEIGQTEKLDQYDIYNKMLDGRSAEDFETEVKKQFIDHPGQMKLLIVVDKLLTGFDAPSATYLYIDKSMRDHGLFQAICRVNRLDGEDKEYGYVVDYKDLFKSLENSIDDYTSEAFDAYDKGDVAGLLENRLEKAAERLEETLERIKALCEPVALPRNTQNYIQYFCGDPEKKEDLKRTEEQRHELYKATVALLRAYANIANEMADAGYNADEIKTVRQEVEHYEKVRTEIKVASGEQIDLKKYEPDMRFLIDTFIRASESEKVSVFEDLTLIQLIVERGMDEAIESLPSGIKNDPENNIPSVIENNARKIITDERGTNPKFFDRMSTLLEEVIKERKAKAIDYEQYLKKIEELTRQLLQKSDQKQYPTTLVSAAQKALYDNLDGNEELAIQVDTEIRNVKKDDWRGNRFKEKEIIRAISKYVAEEDVADRIYGMVRERDDY